MRTKLRRGPTASLLVLAACTLVLALPGCGRRHHRDFFGDVVVENQTQLLNPGPAEDVVEFRIARFREPFGADLLGGVPVPPDTARFLGSVDEDFYDALAELMSGVEVEWADEYIGFERTTTFEVR